MTRFRYDKRGRNVASALPTDRDMQGVEKHMPIAIEFAPSRSKKIAVDVVPAEWQLYIAQ
jgi:hypothetical protein